MISLVYCYEKYAVSSLDFKSSAICSRPLKGMCYDK